MSRTRRASQELWLSAIRPDSLPNLWLFWENLVANSGFRFAMPAVCSQDVVTVIT